MNINQNHAFILYSEKIQVTIIVLSYCYNTIGLPRLCSGKKNPPGNERDAGDVGLISGSRKYPLSRKWQVKVKLKVSQLCLTLCSPVDYTVHGILQARILEWVAFPISRGSSQPRDQTQVSHIADTFFTSGATREVQVEWKSILEWVASPFSSRSSWPRNWTEISCIAGCFFTHWAIRET